MLCVFCVVGVCAVGLPDLHLAPLYQALQGVADALTQFLNRPQAAAPAAPAASGAPAAPAVEVACLLTPSTACLSFMQSPPPPRTALCVFLVDDDTAVPLTCRLMSGVALWNISTDSHAIH